VLVTFTVLTVRGAVGTYYSYLYAKLYAAHIWHTHFAADPLNRYVVFRCVWLLWALAVAVVCCGLRQCQLTVSPPGVLGGWRDRVDQQPCITVALLTLSRRMQHCRALTVLCGHAVGVIGDCYQVTIVSMPLILTSCTLTGMREPT
jgi:hypothetical protein